MGWRAWGDTAWRCDSPDVAVLWRRSQPRDVRRRRLGKAIAANSGDVEAALAGYEKDLYPRGASAAAEADRNLRLFFDDNGLRAWFTCSPIINPSNNWPARAQAFAIQAITTRVMEAAGIAPASPSPQPIVHNAVMTYRLGMAQEMCRKNEAAPGAGRRVARPDAGRQEGYHASWTGHNLTERVGDRVLPLDCRAANNCPRIGFDGSQALRSLPHDALEPGCPVREPVLSRGPSGGRRALQPTGIRFTRSSGAVAMIPMLLRTSCRASSRHLLERDAFARADPRRGRFRTFLLAVCRNFLSDQGEQRQAQKRGGGLAIVSIDHSAAEGRYRVEPADTLTPDRLFERLGTGFTGASPRSTAA